MPPAHSSGPVRSSWPRRSTPEYRVAAAGPSELRTPPPGSSPGVGPTSDARVSAPDATGTREAGDGAGDGAIRDPHGRWGAPRRTRRRSSRPRAGRPAGVAGKPADVGTGPSGAVRSRARGVPATTRYGPADVRPAVRLDGLCGCGRAHPCGRSEAARDRRPSRRRSWTGGASGAPGTGLRPPGGTVGGAAVRHPRPIACRACRAPAERSSSAVWTLIMGGRRGGGVRSRRVHSNDVDGSTDDVPTALRRPVARTGGPRGTCGGKAACRAGSSAAATMSDRPQPGARRSGRHGPGRRGICKGARRGLRRAWGDWLRPGGSRVLSPPSPSHADIGARTRGPLSRQSLPRRRAPPGIERLRRVGSRGGTIRPPKGQRRSVAATVPSRPGHAYPTDVRPRIENADIRRRRVVPIDGDILPRDSVHVDKRRPTATGDADTPQGPATADRRRTGNRRTGHPDASGGGPSLPPAGRAAVPAAPGQADRRVVRHSSDGALPHDRADPADIGPHAGWGPRPGPHALPEAMPKGASRSPTVRGGPFSDPPRSARIPPGEAARLGADHMPGDTARARRPGSDAAPDQTPAVPEGAASAASTRRRTSPERTRRLGDRSFVVPLTRISPDRRCRLRRGRARRSGRIGRIVSRPDLRMRRRRDIGRDRGGGRAGARVTPPRGASPKAASDRGA